MTRIRFEISSTPGASIAKAAFLKFSLGCRRVIDSMAGGRDLFITGITRNALFTANYAEESALRNTRRQPLWGTVVIGSRSGSVAHCCDIHSAEWVGEGLGVVCVGEVVQAERRVHTHLHPHGVLGLVDRLLR